jgi:hypothetical protein
MNDSKGINTIMAAVRSKTNEEFEKALDFALRTAR